MRELFEVLFSIGLPAVALIWSALILARREDRALNGKTQPVPPKRSRRSTVFAPDPDAHLGRVGTE